MLSKVADWGFAANPSLELIIVLKLLEILRHDFIFSWAGVAMWTTWCFGVLSKGEYTSTYSAIVLFGCGGLALCGVKIKQLLLVGQVKSKQRARF